MTSSSSAAPSGEAGKKTGHRAARSRVRRTDRAEVALGRGLAETLSEWKQRIDRESPLPLPPPRSRRHEAHELLPHHAPDAGAHQDRDAPSGWANLQPGTLQAVEKSQGSKGGKVRKLGMIRVVSVRREQLSRLVGTVYGREEAAREGFPDLDGLLRLPLRAEDGHLEDLVTRIEPGACRGPDAMTTAGTSLPKPLRLSVAAKRRGGSGAAAEVEENTVREIVERPSKQAGPYPRIVTITEAELLRGYSRDDRETVMPRTGDPAMSHASAPESRLTAPPRATNTATSAAGTPVGWQRLLLRSDAGRAVATRSGCDRAAGPRFARRSRGVRSATVVSGARIGGPRYADATPATPKKPCTMPRASEGECSPAARVIKASRRRGSSRCSRPASRSPRLPNDFGPDAARICQGSCGPTHPDVRPPMVALVAAFRDERNAEIRRRDAAGRSPKTPPRSVCA